MVKIGNRARWIRSNQMGPNWLLYSVFKQRPYRTAWQCTEVDRKWNYEWCILLFRTRSVNSKDLTHALRGFLSLCFASSIPLNSKMVIEIERLNLQLYQKGWAFKFIRTINSWNPPSKNRPWKQHRFLWESQLELPFPWTLPHYRRRQAFPLKLRQHRRLRSLPSMQPYS